MTTTVAAMKDAAGQLVGINVISLYTVYGQTAPIKVDAIARLKQYTEQMDDVAIRGCIAFLQKLGSASEPVWKDVIEQQFNALKLEENAMVKRSNERLELCIEHKETVSSSKLEGLILDGFDVEANASALLWVEAAANSLSRLSDDFPLEVCKRALDVVSRRVGSERVPALYAIFSKSLVHVTSPEDAELLKRYMKQLSSDDASLRSAAAKSFESVRIAKESLGPFVIMDVEALLLELSAVPDERLKGVKVVLDALLAYPDSINARGFQLICHIAKRFLGMQEKDESVYGLSLVERCVKIEGSDISDIVHLAVNLGRLDSQLNVRVRAVLDRLISHSDEDARNKADEFIREMDSPKPDPS